MMLGSIIYFGIIFCLSGFLIIIVSNINYIKNIKCFKCFNVLIFKIYNLYTQYVLCVHSYLFKLLLFIFSYFVTIIISDYIIQLIINEQINAKNLSQIYYMVATIIIFFMQTFFYCYVGELMAEQVSYNFVHTHIF